MPAGGHPILSQTRQAVERRARTLLAQLHELQSNAVAEAPDEGNVERAEAAVNA